MEAAKKRRASAKGWLTRAITNMQNIISDETSDLVDLQHTLLELNKRTECYEAAQNAVECLVEEEDLEQEIEESGEIFDQTLNLKKSAERRINRLSADANEDDSVLHKSVGATVKLPKLELPKFKGEVTEWPTFWDKYKATIHESDLPSVTKFTYLQSLLEGEAKTLIDGLSLTEKHYETACELLVDRFGRKELIISSHIQSLLNLKPNETCKESLTKLRSLQDQVNIHVRSLEAQEIDSKTCGIFLTPLVLSRLPPDVHLEWAREGKGKEGDLSWLLTFLKEEISRRERAESFKLNKFPDDGKREERIPKPNVNRRLVTAAALHSTTEMECVFCGKRNHGSPQCWTAKKLTLDDRKQAVLKANLCFRCLASTHLAKDCKAQSDKCNRGHHKTLCPSTGRDVKVENRAEKPQVNLVAEKEDSGSENRSISCLAKTTRQSVVLSTAKVKVASSSGAKHVSILFDSGSGRTYVTKDIAKKLKLREVDQVEHRYSVFGGNATTASMIPLREIDLIALSGQIHKINAIEVPVICNPIARPEIPQDILNLVPGVQFAECQEGRFKVDVLIGLDNFWTLMRSIYYVFLSIIGSPRDSFWICVIWPSSRK